MISTILKGGLGNQMFQISAAHSIALKHNDVSGFDFDNCTTNLQGNPANTYRDTIFQNVNKIKNYKFENLHVEKKHSFENISYKNNLLLDGYFQSEKYFYEFKEEIINLFKIDGFFDEEIFNTFSFDRPTVSVHVRRGDYLNFPKIHPTCSIDYYIESMSFFPNHNFIFISDDIRWVMENFKGPNIKYSNFNNEIKDLRLMTLCHHNIISNSTFSWWGAYLNKNSEKKIISPKTWFGPMGPKDQEDIIPINWLKI